MSHSKFPSLLPIVRASAWAVLPAIAGLGLWACGTDDDDHDEATVTIVTPADGSTVTGPAVKLQVSTTNFSFASAAGKIAAAQHGGVEGGHIHVFLDKPAGLDADAITTLSKADTVTLNIATPGKHYIIVEGADASHEDVESMSDSVSFTVALP
jgi:hypothetical protein